MILASNLNRIALSAKQIVTQASLVAKKVQKNIHTTDVISKKDLSPVTIVDYAVQASIALFLQREFPDHEFRMIAEEDASFLRNNPSAETKLKLLNVIKDILAQEVDIDDALNALDRCHYKGDISNDYWILDPIDGTKGFISNSQFAIGLSYVHQGVPVIGVVGCPNLAFDVHEINWTSNVDGVGSVAVGIAGAGTTVYDLFSSRNRLVHVKDTHAPFSGVMSRQLVNHTSTLGKLLDQMKLPNSILEIDSMCKYVVIAIGLADIYLRQNAHPTYKENVWDHAAGMVVLQEAGGIVTDLKGKPLDYTKGDKLYDNCGVVASRKELHEEVMNALHKIYNDTTVS